MTSHSEARADVTHTSFRPPPIPPLCSCPGADDPGDLTPVPSSRVTAHSGQASTDSARMCSCACVRIPHGTHICTRVQAHVPYGWPRHSKSHRCPEAMGTGACAAHTYVHMQILPGAPPPICGSSHENACHSLNQAAQSWHLPPHSSRCC